MPQTIGLPLSSQLEQGKRGLWDALQQSLAGINAQRQQAPYFANVGLGRLNLAAGEERKSIEERLAERGVFDSTIRGRDLGRMSERYNQQRQDIGFDLARQLADLAQKQSGAQGAYNKGLYDLMVQSAQQSAQDRSLPYYANPPTKLATGSSGPLIGYSRVVR